MILVILVTVNLLTTLPKTNIAPENRPSQKESLPAIHFQVRTVSFGEVKASVYPPFSHLFFALQKMCLFFFLLVGIGGVVVTVGWLGPLTV